MRWLFPFLIVVLVGCSSGRQSDPFRVVVRGENHQDIRGRTEHYLRHWYNVTGYRPTGTTTVTYDPDFVTRANPRADAVTDPARRIIYFKKISESAIAHEAMHITLSNRDHPSTIQNKYTGAIINLDRDVPYWRYTRMRYGK